MYPALFMEGGTVFMGSPNEKAKGFMQGAAFVFEQDAGGTDQWEERQMLFPEDMLYVTDERFGRSVSIRGDTLAVGAFQDDDAGSNAGAVYIFERNLLQPGAWGQYRKIYSLNDTTAGGDSFGWSVSVDAGLLLAGAYGDDDLGSSAGAAYVYDRNKPGSDGWGYDKVKKLLPIDGAASDRFGYAVALSGDTAVVGAYQDDDNGSNSGSAYVFQQDHGGTDNWGQVRKLIPADGAASDYFGFAVAVSGDTVAVGAYQDDDNGSSSGSVYIFERDADGSDIW